MSVPKPWPPQSRLLHEGRRAGGGGCVRAGRRHPGAGGGRDVRQFSPFNPSVQAAVVFQDSIAGLSVGAPVTFRGVRVGAVESIAIEFDPKTKVAYIPVIVTLKPDRAPGARQDAGDIAKLPQLMDAGVAGGTESAELRHRTVADRPGFRSRVAGGPASRYHDVAGNSDAANPPCNVPPSSSASCRCGNWRTTRPRR